MSPATRRKLLVVPIAFVLLFAANEARESWQFSSDDRGFHAITGRELPPDVVALAHASAHDDNFFRESHYWLLRGSVDTLRDLAPVPVFERSDDDAVQWLAGAAGELALGDAKMLEGYEGSYDAGGDRWLLILAPGDRAVFVY